MSRWSNGRTLQLLALTALLAGVGLISMQRKLSVLGSDIGWHLKTGEWILEHHAFPHSGIFSRTAADRPWIAYSWGYEVLLATGYARFGLVGIAAYGTALTLMVVFSIFWMAQRLSRRFWLAWLLAAACSYAILLLRIVPRPAFFSIALFCVLLGLVFEAQVSGRVQPLLWTPLIFFVWANLHIQFVYGLAALALLLAVNFAQQIAERAHISPSSWASATLPSASLAMIFALCVLATMISPYSYHLYGVIFRYSQAKVSYAMVQELQPFRLRFYANYVQLVLAAGALLALALRKRLDVFKLLLLILASVFAFRTMRDAWFQCTVAVACLADTARAPREAEAQPGRWALAAVVPAVALAMFIGARSTHFNEAELQRRIAAMYPAEAVNYLREKQPPGPLWNIFDWGGFLTWYLPEYPVAIDPRTDLYGDELLDRFHLTELGDPGYRDDPYLNEAGVVLVRTNGPLAQLLRNDDRLRQVYQDRIATVFERR